MSWFVSSAPSRIAANDPLLLAEVEILFGEQPPIRPGPNPPRAAWEYALRYHEGITDSGYAEDQTEAAIAMFVAAGFSRPVFFRQRGRTLARFAENAIDVNPDAAAVVHGTEQIIAAMQINLILRGVKVDNPNRFVPGRYLKINSELP